MNLKKTVFSLFAAAAMTMVLITPNIAAEEARGTVVDDGEVSATEMWYEGVNLPDAVVTASLNDTVTGESRVVINDTYSTSPGWEVTMIATDFDDGDGHSIPAANLSISFNTFAVYSSGCPPISNTEPYQVLTGSGGNLATATTVMSATDGRGCGNISGVYDFTLLVEAGTFTGSTEQYYESTLTLTTTVNTP